MNPEVSIALNILKVDNVLAIYNLGHKALTKQINFKRFLKTEKKMNLHARRNHLFFLDNQTYLKYVGEVCQDLTQHEEARYPTRKKMQNVNFNMAKLIHELFTFETHIVPRVFLHRKAYWDFLKKLFGSKLTNFVEEADQYWLELDEYPIPSAYKTLWEDGMLNPECVFECVQDLECLHIPYVCFALDVDNWELQLTKATPKLLEITQQTINQQNAQKLQSIDHLKFEAMKTLHQKNMMSEKASQLLMKVGTKLTNTNMCGSIPYKRAEYVYKLIKTQTDTMKELCQTFRQKSSIELEQTISAIESKHKETLVHLQQLCTEIPDFNGEWSQVKEIIDTKDLHASSLMLKSAVKLENM